jgi:hypothetical protein
MAKTPIFFGLRKYDNPGLIGVYNKQRRTAFLPIGALYNVEALKSQYSFELALNQQRENLDFYIRAADMLSIATPMNLDDGLQDLLKKAQQVAM